MAGMFISLLSLLFITATADVEFPEDPINQPSNPENELRLSYKNNYCRTQFGMYGVCREVHNCLHEMNTILGGSLPAICSWRSAFPVICCPIDIYQPYPQQPWPPRPGPRPTSPGPRPSRPGPRPPHPGHWPPHPGHWPPHPGHWPPHPGPSYPQPPRNINEVCGRRRLPRSADFAFPEQSLAEGGIKDVSIENAIEKLKSQFSEANSGLNGVVLEDQNEGKNKIDELNAQDADSQKEISVRVGSGGAGAASHPWIASVGYVNTYNYAEWVCSGTLISEYYVTTSAHCTNVSISRVRLGHQDLTTGVLYDSDTIEINIEQVIVHTKYRPGEVYHDIALVKLQKKVQFTRRITPACLPPANFVVPRGSSLVEAGLGRGPSSYLHQGIVNAQDANSCQLSLSRTQGISQKAAEYVKRGEALCATKRISSSRQCQTDSGGPLLYRQQQNSPAILIGVVSSGVACGNLYDGDLYAKISDNLDFIRQHVDFSLTQ